MAAEEIKNNKRELLCDDIAGKGCGLKKVIDIVGGKWKIMILCVIDYKEVVRYGELNRSVHGITNTMLANSLKELEADGLVERKQYDEMPVRVEYNLTDKAKSLIPILLELKKWGEENLVWRIADERKKGTIKVTGVKGKDRKKLLKAIKKQTNAVIK